MTAPTLALPLVSIVVPTFNNCHTLALCLQSLQNQNYSHFECIVVNDGSTDGSGDIAAEWVEKDTRFHLVSLPRQQGPGAARNAALRHARGEVVAFIDGDIAAPADWLDKLLAPLLRDEADCSGGPDYVPTTAPLRSRCIGWSVDSVLASGGLRRGGTPLVRYLPGTGNMAVWRRTLQQAGQFDEHFRDTGEDKELLLRVQQSGARIRYVEEAPVWHYRSPHLGTHARKMFLYGVRRVDIWRRHRGSVEWAHVLPALLTLILLVAVLSAPYLAAARLLCEAALMALLAESVAGAYALGDVRALLLCAVTSAVVPLGYGAGILVRLLQPRPSGDA